MRLASAALNLRLGDDKSTRGAERLTSLSLLPYVIRPGSDVIDVGANFGAYTRVMAGHAGSRGRVFAFEPVPPVAEILERSCAALENVVVMREALSEDAEETLELRMFPIVYDVFVTLPRVAPELAWRYVARRDSFSQPGTPEAPDPH